jgi:hypothetical protein
MTAELMTPTEVAEALDCTPETVNAKLAAHDRVGVGVDRQHRVAGHDLARARVCPFRPQAGQRAASPGDNRSAPT